MRRREFIAGIAAATLWPLAGSAQKRGEVRRVGILQTGGTEIGHRKVDAFKRGLAEIGWAEGRNVRFEDRWTNDDPDLLPRYAAELAKLALDAIYVSNSPCLRAMRSATSETPIVFSTITDPVGQGFVSSLSHPGGNITGFAGPEYGLSTKILELVKTLAPNVDHIAILHDPGQPASLGKFAEIEAAAPSFPPRVTKVPVRTADDINRSIAALANEPKGGIIVDAGPSTTLYRERIAALALQHQLPLFSEFLWFVESGALASYGVDDEELSRRAASYVDRILKGEMPRDLPVQLPTKFVFAINLKTAKALGLTVPETLLAIADEVIQ